MLSIKYIKMTPVMQFDSTHTFFKFHKDRYKEINKYILSSFNRDQTFSDPDLNSFVCALSDALHFTVLKCVPKSSFIKSSFPSWVSKHMKDLIFQTKRAHPRYRTSGSIAHYRKFSFLRALNKFEAKRCFKSFFPNAEKS